MAKCENGGRAVNESTQPRDDQPERRADAPARSTGESAAPGTAEPTDARVLATGEDGVAGAVGNTERRRAFGRRGFLAGTAAAVAGLGVAHYLPPGATLARLVHEQRPNLNPHDDPISITPPLDDSYDYFVQVERDADMLLLDFYFYNFTTLGGPDPLYLAPTGASNYIIVRMPPQAICEAVYWQDDGNANGNHQSDPTGLPADPSPILSALSGQSQLSFTLNESDAILITGSVNDLLDWSTWTLNVPAVAQQPQDLSDPAIYGIPTSFDTFIEFPYCLYLAPSVWVGAPSLEVGNFPLPIGFTTSFSNRATPLGDVVDTSTGATVNEIFASTLVQQPADVLDVGYVPGLAAVYCTDLVGVPYRPATDMTPEENISYEGQPAQ